MAPLHPSDSHTQTHTAVIIIKPNCKTSLAACQTEPVPNQPSCGPNTHRQVRRTCWTEPRLSLLGFPDPFFGVPLLSAVCLFTFLSLTSCRWSPLLKSKSLMGLTSGHKPCFTARPRRVREARMRASVLTERGRWRGFWAEAAGGRSSFT